MFERDPSAITAISDGSKAWRREPERTQWGSVGLRDADLKDDQDLQQQIAGLDVDQSSMACLWLQSWSRTEACLMKTVLKDGVWQGT